MTESILGVPHGPAAGAGARFTYGLRVFDPPLGYHTHTSLVQWTAHALAEGEIKVRFLDEVCGGDGGGGGGGGGGGAGGIVRGQAGCPSRFPSLPM